jgi:hypothetical protein
MHKVNSLPMYVSSEPGSEVEHDPSVAEGVPTAGFRKSVARDAVDRTGHRSGRVRDWLEVSSFV